MQTTLADKNYDETTRRKATASVAWAIARNTGLYADADDEMQRRGLGRFTRKDVVTTGDVAGIDSATGAFLALVDERTVIGRLAGAVRLPVGTAARTTIGSVEASTVDEGNPKPVAHLAFDVPPFRPSKVAAQIVASAEVVRAIDAQTQSGLRDVLVAAVARQTDRYTVSTLTAGSSTGDPSPGALLGAISSERPALISDVITALSWPAGTVRDLAALGIPVLTTPAAAGFVIAVDAAGLLLSDTGAIVESAQHASLTLAGSPEQGVNLWQRNLIALRCERWMKLIARPGAIAFSSVGSPS